LADTRPYLVAEPDETQDIRFPGEIADPAESRFGLGVRVAAREWHHVRHVEGLHPGEPPTGGHVVRRDDAHRVDRAEDVALVSSCGVPLLLGQQSLWPPLVSCELRKAVALDVELAQDHTRVGLEPPDERKVMG